MEELISEPELVRVSDSEFAVWWYQTSPITGQHQVSFSIYTIAGVVQAQQRLIVDSRLSMFRLQGLRLIIHGFGYRLIGNAAGIRVTPTAEDWNRWNFDFESRYSRDGVLLNTQFWKSSALSRTNRYGESRYVLDSPPWIAGATKSETWYVDWFGDGPVALRCVDEECGLELCEVMTVGWESEEPAYFYQQSGIPDPWSTAQRDWFNFWLNSLHEFPADLDGIWALAVRTYEDPRVVIERFDCNGRTSIRAELDGNRIVTWVRSAVLHGNTGLRWNAAFPWIIFVPTVSQSAPISCQLWQCKNGTISHFGELELHGPESSMLASKLPTLVGSRIVNVFTGPQFGSVIARVHSIEKPDYLDIVLNRREIDLNTSVVKHLPY